MLQYNLHSIEIQMETTKDLMNKTQNEVQAFMPFQGELSQSKLSRDLITLQHQIQAQLLEFKQLGDLGMMSMLSWQFKKEKAETDQLLTQLQIENFDLQKHTSNQEIKEIMDFIQLQFDLMKQNISQGLINDESEVGNKKLNKISSIIGLMDQLTAKHVLERTKKMSIDVTSELETSQRGINEENAEKIDHVNEMSSLLERINSDYEVHRKSYENYEKSLCQLLEDLKDLLQPQTPRLRVSS